MYKELLLAVPCCIIVLFAQHHAFQSRAWKDATHSGNRTFRYVQTTGLGSEASRHILLQMSSLFIPLYPYMMVLSFDVRKKECKDND